MGPERILKDQGWGKRDLADFELGKAILSRYRGGKWRQRVRGHLGVGVLDEGIHQDHQQDGDGHPEVPNDSAQL